MTKDELKMYHLLLRGTKLMEGVNPPFTEFQDEAKIFLKEFEGRVISNSPIRPPRPRPSKLLRSKS